MGNDIEENNLNKIDKEEIIENDCYEEIDLNKINKIIEKEKNWNTNSIIVSLNELDLKKINEDKENIEGNKGKEKNNEELACKVIEEQKNEEGSEDGKNKENKENEQNEQNNNNNDNNANNDEKENEKEKEKKELNENDNNNEVNKNEINNNETNDKVNGIINISNRQDENKKEDAPKENNNVDNTKDAKDTKDTEYDNNNKDNAGDNNDKNNQEKEKIKNKVKKGKKPRIRPKNTSDEALKGENGKIIKYRKQRNNNNNNDKSPNQKDGKEDNNAKNDINKNEPNKNEKKINNPPVEKKDPSEEFDIKNIISEYRLNHLKDDEIIYSGTLDKILKIPDKNTIAYSQRFCIFTKNYFAYYKSKESYISVNKPMLLINNKFIIRIENTILGGGSYYFGIICEVNDETRSLINKVNSFVTNEANTCELLLGFRTKEYENMMKWVVVLRYFISNQKEDF